MGKPFGRTYAWNTLADSSGTFYRGNHTVTEDMPDNLTLYQGWVSANDTFKLADNINNDKLYNIYIKLEQEDHENPNNPNNSEYDVNLPYPNYVNGMGDDDTKGNLSPENQTIIYEYELDENPENKDNPKKDNEKTKNKKLSKTGAVTDTNSLLIISTLIVSVLLLRRKLSK